MDVRRYVSIGRTTARLVADKPRERGTGRPISRQEPVHPIEVAVLEEVDVPSEEGWGLASIQRGHHEPRTRGNHLVTVPTQPSASDRVLEEGVDRVECSAVACPQEDDIIAHRARDERVLRRLNGELGAEQLARQIGGAHQDAA